jgi:energy-coupling factor transport system ATP-binding protein
VSRARPADENTPASARLPISADGARLDLRDLTWRPFGRHAPILSGITLRVEPGERILLTGPSGSGKSTLLRAIAGVLTTVESGVLTGSISIDGKDSHEGGSSVGLLVQDPTDAMVAGCVGREVAFGPENLGVPRERIWALVRESLDAVGFPYGLDHPVGAVSGGESQRLALAGVLALGPRLIVLDEPTAMLDRASATAVREAIWAVVRESGATVIVVEHHFDGWLDEIDRVVVLNATGGIAGDGPAATMLLDHAESLEKLGVWVPGASAPTPLGVLPELCAPGLSGGAPGSALVRAESVSVLRGPRALLRHVDAVARAGEIVAVVGASGAGKSTLTGLLAGLGAPSSGVVSAGQELRAGAGPNPALWRSRDLARRVGWVPQQAELAVVARTVWHDVMSTSRLLDLDEKTAVLRADALLVTLGLSGLRDADPHLLSGGELRRLALAGAVAHGPSVLVLDEPTVGQDRHTWAAVAGVIASSRAAGVAVVVATHDPLLMQLADRMIRLDHGRVIEVVDRNGAGSASAPKTEPGRAAADVAAPPTPARRQSLAGLAARSGPLSLLGSSILFIIGALFITDVRGAALGIALELLLAPFVFGWGRPSLRLLPGLLAVASVGFSGWMLSPGQDLAVGATSGLRVAFFVLPGVLLAGLADPFALGDHLAQRLRLPARPVVAAAAAMQRFDTLGEQWEQLRRTRRIRGLDGGRSPRARVRHVAALTFGLLIQSLRQSGRMAVAMESRGFSSARATGVRRTWAEPAPWSAADSALLGLGLVVAATPALLSLLTRASG